MRDIVVKRSTYLDSVTLMRVSKEASELDGIAGVIVAMATDTNLLMIKEAGFDVESLGELTPSDLVIAIEAQNNEALARAHDFIRAETEARFKSHGEAELRPASLDTALASFPEINMVLISVPGQFAANEAYKALRNRRHVMIFSDNVSEEDEKNLKALAQSRRLLLMGPDCGTAIINNLGLGFANKVPRGEIGIVAASGTGAQEVSSILARLGLGISQLIGTGGRDLSGQIGGITTRMALEALIEDSSTKVIVLISKLPDEKVASDILNLLGGTKKPVIIYFAGHLESKTQANLTFTPTLTETALEAARAATGKSFKSAISLSKQDEKKVMQLRQGQPSSRKYLRGLFTGGTLAQEALFILGSTIGPISTNTHITDFPALEDPTQSIEHTIVDLGDDAFTRGRAHPMIDQTYRLRRLARELSDATVSVILLDVVLGYGCNDDPAGEIVQTIKATIARDKLGEGDAMVIASICGTHGDPQNYLAQKEKLTSCGVIVAQTNALAAKLAQRAIVGNKNA